MSVYEKLIKVQAELKAPKGQYNSFGKYKYRSCEDILEAVKPILAKYKAAIILSDSIENYGKDTYTENKKESVVTEDCTRVYVKATAKFIDAETGEMVESTAYAREERVKKGMDGSQITGTASSYARKYCLNGLLLIDDTKDADTDEYKEQQENKKPEAPKAEAPKQEAREAVKFTGDRCLVLMQEGYKDVTSLARGTLEKLLQYKQYVKAYSAIKCELDVRSLRGE